jgi:hypothetical protein
MKNKTFKYILFVFAKSKNQDDFVTEIAEEIAVITKSKNIRYYYGPEACVFTFSTLDDLKSVTEYVDIILSEGEVSYFLLPYSPDNMSFGLPKDISEHLFTDKLSDIEKMDRDLDVKWNKLDSDFKKLDEEMFDKFMNAFSDEDEEDDDISKLIKRTKTTKVDDYVSENEFNFILDKINSDGMSSLTKKELNLLKQYSNQVKK